MVTPLQNNSTIPGIISTTTSTGFTSGSFTRQKQPIIPSDQKAKLLAMHRDGKANAGIYVAVVLLVYFVLVTLLLCRYGKRRRTTTSEPPSGLDSTAEQGCFRFLNFQTCKPIFCTSEDGCCKCFFRVCCCSRHGSQTDNVSGKPVITRNNEFARELKSTPKLNVSTIIATKDDRLQEKGNEESCHKLDNGDEIVQQSGTLSNDSKTFPDTEPHVESENGESTEED